MKIDDTVIVTKYIKPYEAKILQVYYLDNKIVNCFVENTFTQETEHIKPEDILQTEG
jgi:hypothetical protein